MTSSEAAEVVAPPKVSERPADVFFKALAQRRTTYDLMNKSSIPDERIVEIVQQAGERLELYRDWKLRC